MALPATETFTGTDTTSPPNANWTNKTNGISIQTNGFRGNVSAVNGAFWNADTFNDKHYAKAKAVALAAGNSRGPDIRVQTGAANSLYYCLRDNDGKTYNGELIAGSPTDWDAGLTAPALGTVLELHVDATTATTIVYKEAGVTKATYTGKSALSGGAAGVSAYEAGTTSYGDDWEGGNVAVAGGTILPQMIQQGLYTGGAR